jgi:hypothetical protein
MRLTTLAVVRAALCALALTSSAAAAQPLAAHPGAQAQAPADEARIYAGKVLETMDSGGYTYLKIATPEGEVWGAVLPVKVKVGDVVKIVNSVVMTDFEAKSLGRTFDRIVFGNLEGTAPSSPGGGTPGSLHGAARQETMQVTSPAPKVEGADGRTIAEIWAQRAQLQGKPVALRGQVVKFNGSIMGKNWLHLQDGTGTQEASNFDLTVTTADEAKVGDMVVVRGVVQVDKDVGAGYSYPVLIEDAKVTN